MILLTVLYQISYFYILWSYLDDKMDNLDMKILSRLLNNCRESDRQIGIELGISGGAIRARIQ